MQRAALLASSLGLVGLMGCGPAPEDGGVQPTLASIQDEVFSPSCSLGSCHSSESHNADLILEPDTAYAELVGVDPQNAAALEAGMKRVDPGDPDNSLLYLKVMPGIAGHAEDFGDPMPWGSDDGAEPDVVEAIRGWIEDGASES
jgi:hypothetical protein